MTSSFVVVHGTALSDHPHRIANSLGLPGNPDRLGPPGFRPLPMAAIPEASR